MAYFKNPLAPLPVALNSIVQRIVERQHPPRRRAQPALHLLAQQFLLILLLRLVRARVVRRAWRAAASPCDSPSRRATCARSSPPRSPPLPSPALRPAANRTGRRRRQPAPPVRARHHAGGAVFRREIVQHPDRIAHPVAALVGDRAAIGMPGLRAIAHADRRTRTFRLLSLNSGPSTCSMHSSTCGVRITRSKTSPLSTRFARRRAFGSCLNSDPALRPSSAKSSSTRARTSSQQFRTHQIGQHQVAALIELSLFGVAQHNVPPPDPAASASSAGRRRIPPDCRSIRSRGGRAR